MSHFVSFVPVLFSSPDPPPHFGNRHQRRDRPKAERETSDPARPVSGDAVVDFIRR